MFTFKPASKNGNGHAHGQNGNGNGNGHSGGLFGNLNGRGNGNGNGHSNKVDSVLGPGLYLKGTLSGAGGVRIEGTFDGSISVKGPVVITDGAKVTADIDASSVSVGGSLKGNITAGKVEILATGRVWGDLVTSAFATEEGAFLRGQVRMEEAVPAPVAEPEAVPVGGLVASAPNGTH